MMKLYLLLGGNIGNCKECFAKAREMLIENVGEELQISALYESEAWGFESEHKFLNQVLIYSTKLSPDAVLQQTQMIEKKLGRLAKTTIAYESRPIDIDILFYENEIVDLPYLKIPHPLLHQRRFTLMPLEEIASNFMHPVLKKHIYELLAECEDQSVVMRILKKTKC